MPGEGTAAIHDEELQLCMVRERRLRVVMSRRQGPRPKWLDVWWRKVQFAGKVSPALATDAIRCPVPCLVGCCSLDVGDMV